MFYKTLDVIPLKLFLEILKDKNFTRLSDKPKDVFDCEKVWKQMLEDFKKLDPENNTDKLLKTLIKVNKYRAQYNAIVTSIIALRFDRDFDLENLIRSQGFVLTEANFQKDLDKIEIDVEAIKLLINEHSAKLPSKSKDSKDKAGNIDEVILGYCSATGLSFDTNAITVTQFYALKKIFDQKMKHLKDQNEKNKKK